MGVPSSCRLPPVNVNRPLSITPIQTHLIQLLSEGGERLEGMQINPQVNTSIIRSVTLQHCPRGMCEFHPEGSQMGDNRSNQVLSERLCHLKCVCECFKRGKSKENLLIISLVSSLGCWQRHQPKTSAVSLYIMLRQDCQDSAMWAKQTILISLYPAPLPVSFF